MSNGIWDLSPAGKLKFIKEEYYREKDIHLERLRFIAEHRKAAFDIYVAQGFTPEQALILCRDV